MADLILQGCRGHSEESDVPRHFLLGGGGDVLTY